MEVVVAVFALFVRVLCRSSHITQTQTASRRKNSLQLAQINRLNRPAVRFATEACQTTFLKPLNFIFPDAMAV